MKPKATAIPPSFDVQTYDPQLFKKIADITPLAIYIIDLVEKNVIYYNLAAVQLLHYTTHTEENPGKTILDTTLKLNHFNTIQELAVHFANTKNDEAITHQIRYTKADGKVLWLHQREVIFKRLEDHLPHQILFIIEDISEQKKNEENLLRFSQALEMTSDAVLITDLVTRVVNVNQSALLLYGAEHKEDMIGLEVLNLIIPADQEKALEGMQTILKKGYMQSQEYRIYRRNQEIIPVEMSISMMSNSEKTFLGFVVIIRDIAERKATEERLKFISSYDVLTKIYNRFSYEEEITRLENDPRQYPISIIMIDTDGLKLINDTLGHSRGDELLVRVAQLLKVSFREEDFIARIGGDEFAVIMTRTDGESLEKSITRLQNNINIENRYLEDFKIDISLGGSTACEESSLRKAIFQADERMYQQKNTKKAKGQV